MAEKKSASEAGAKSINCNSRQKHSIKEKTCIVIDGL